MENRIQKNIKNIDSKEDINLTSIRPQLDLKWFVIISISRNWFTCVFIPVEIGLLVYLC